MAVRHVPRADRKKEIRFRPMSSDDVSVPLFRFLVRCLQAQVKKPVVSKRVRLDDRAH
jgi:hypothetical protein